MVDAQTRFYELRSNGVGLNEARSLLGIPRRLAREWTRNAPLRLPTCRLRPVDREQIRDCLLRLGYSYRRTAEVLGCHKSTVGRWACRWRCEDDGDADPEVDLKFERQRRYCAIHGAVNVWPCVACAAIEHAAGSRLHASQPAK